MKPVSQILSVLFIGILIALTGAACQLDVSLSELDLPFLPTSTNTPLPTKTTTPTPTLPPKIEGSGEFLQLEILENEFSVFTDKQLGYQVIFSPEWLVIPAEADLQAKILERSANMLQESATSMITKSMQQAGIRMAAVDYTGRYEVSSRYTSNINIILDESPARQATPLEDILDQIVADMPESMPDAKLVYQSIETNLNQVEYALLIITFEREVYGVPVKEVVAMIKLDTGLLTITGAGHEESYLDMERTFKNVFDSFMFVE